jgi:hypothetical protein
MKKLQKTNQLYFLLVIFFLAIVSCSKEPLSIAELPVTEAESTWYQLAENSFELSVAEYDELVTNRTPEGITIRKNSTTEVLKAGDILVTSWDIETEKALMREIVNVSEMGDEMIFETQPTTIIKAYQQYHIDSNNPNIIKARSSVNLKDFFVGASAGTSVALSTLARNWSPDFEVDFDFIMTGEVSFLASHPNKLYSDLTKSSPIGTKEEVDENCNGIWDIAEVYFQIDPSNIDDEGYYKSGFYTIVINDFGFEKFNLGFSDTQGKLKLGKYYPLSNVASSSKDLWEGLSQAVIREPNVDPTYTMKYIPLLPSGPTVNLYAGLAPLFEPVIKASYFAGVEISGDTKFDLQIGHIDIYDILNKPILGTESFPVGDLAIDLRDKTGDVAEFSDILSGLSMEFTAGVKGSFSAKTGVYLGLGIGIGEPNSVGSASGLLLPIGIKPAISGKAALKLSETSNILSGGLPVLDVDGGDICATMEIGLLDAFFFFDGNLPLPGKLGDGLDYTLKIPDKGFIELLEVEVLSYLTGDPKGLCVDFACVSGIPTSGIRLDKFEYSISSTEMSIEYKVSNIMGNENAHSIYLKSGDDELSIDETVDLGQTKMSIKELTDVWKDKLISKDFEIVVAVSGCEKSYSSSSASFFQVGCLEYITQASSAGHEVFPSENNGDMLLMRNSVAKSFYSTHIKSFGETELTIRNLTVEGCLNPTGLIEQKSDTFWDFGDSGKAYIWVEDQEGVDQFGNPIVYNAFEINFNPEGGELDLSFIKRSLSISSYAAVLKL